MYGGTDCYHDNFTNSNQIKELMTQLADVEMKDWHGVEWGQKVLVIFDNLFGTFPETREQEGFCCCVVQIGEV